MSEIAKPAAMLATTYQRELIADLWDEAMPLLRAHWEEIAHYRDIPLAPRRDAYEKLETAGACYCYTARVGGDRLVGYFVAIVAPHMHYGGSLHATQDVLFVLPQYRKSRIGLGLLRFGERELTALGVQVVTQHVKVAHDFGALLQRLGYEHIENIHAKRLDHGL